MAKLQYLKIYEKERTDAAGKTLLINEIKEVPIKGEFDFKRTLVLAASIEDAMGKNFEIFAQAPGFPPRKVFDGLYEGKENPAVLIVKWSNVVFKNPGDYIFSLYELGNERKKLGETRIRAERS